MTKTPQSLPGKVHLLKATATIGGLTLISRILGFVRDTLGAQYLGAGPANDAFLIAWRLPNLFRALFAEGAFASAFVPMFNRTISEAEKKGQDGMAAGLRFASDVLSVLLPLLLLFEVGMIAAAEPIVEIMTGGFPAGTAGEFQLAVFLTRLTMPYLALISIVTLLGGILNSLHRFWVNAAAPILLNVGLIVGLIFFRSSNSFMTAQTQALAVSLSGVLQLGWLLWACHQAGIHLYPHWPKFTPAVKKMLSITWPAALGAGAVQFNLLISTALAARYLPEGAVSYLYYADRLNQLPLGLVGIGIGTAILPALSRQLATNDKDAAIHTQNRAIELALFLTLPATFGLIVTAGPLIRALLQHGAFSAVDSLNSARALSAFSLGLPAYVLIKILTPGFHARTDTRTPVRIAILAMLLNLILNLLLLHPLGHVGLALSTAISAWANVVMLYILLRRRRHFYCDGPLLRRSPRMVIAGGIMALGLWPFIGWFNQLAIGHIMHRITALILLLLLGSVLYFGSAVLIGAFPWKEVRRFLRRR
ncbi:MAG: murein biosynthesis integral membrane protein MurJ [Zymomonas mobilis subsp. pomaceae]|uniref:murein biosynthesis integral membrane protein MurJ n=1 Tax=Zymomonas mobilis TaxID=542 RepID=UPI0039E93AFC